MTFDSFLVGFALSSSEVVSSKVIWYGGLGAVNLLGGESHIHVGDVLARGCDYAVRNLGRNVDDVPGRDGGTLAALDPGASICALANAFRSCAFQVANPCGSAANAGSKATSGNERSTASGFFRAFFIIRLIGRGETPSQFSQVVMIL